MGAPPPQFNPHDPKGQFAHDNKGPLLIGVSWALTGVATVFLCLRLYCKFYIRQRLWWDDWILIAAWFTIVADDTVTHVLVHEFGIGRHSWDLRTDRPATFLTLLNTRATLSITAIAWTKIAFAVRLLRLTEGNVYRFIWFIIISINITMGFSGAVSWIRCLPIPKSWDPTIPGLCWAQDVATIIWIVTGAYSGALDFVMAALPWTFLWKLRMRRKEKIGVAVAMSMGIVAGITAIIKCVKLPKLDDPDSYGAIDLYFWDVTESTATMIAACIPSLRVLIRDVTNTSAHVRSFNLPYISAKPSTGQNKESAPSTKITESV